jgi:hypothetical protein
MNSLIPFFMWLNLGCAIISAAQGQVGGALFNLAVAGLLYTSLPTDTKPTDKKKDG